MILGLVHQLLDVAVGERWLLASKFGQSIRSGPLFGILLAPPPSRGVTLTGDLCGNFEILAVRIISSSVIAVDEFNAVALATVIDEPVSITLI